MADLELVFNEESGVWEERKEPYIRVEIETEEDFEHLKAAIELYKNRDNLTEIVHGHWTIFDDGYGCELMSCSVCKAEFYDGDNDTVDHTHNYCPNCGAKMDGEQR